MYTKYFDIMHIDGKYVRVASRDRLVFPFTKKSTFFFTFTRRRRPFMLIYRKSNLLALIRKRVRLYSD